MCFLPFLYFLCFLTSRFKEMAEVPERKFKPSLENLTAWNLTQRALHEKALAAAGVRGLGMSVLRIELAAVRHSSEEVFVEEPGSTLLSTKPTTSAKARADGAIWVLVRCV